jgi:hypothetical protein
LVHPPEVSGGGGIVPKDGLLAAGTQPGRKRWQARTSPVMHSALRSFFSSHRAAEAYPDAADKPQSKPRPAESRIPPVFVLWL